MNKCKRCGGDLDWRMKEADRTLRDAEIMWKKAEVIARENGFLRFQRDVALAKVDDVSRGMQRKIQRQARAIRKLEEKLLAKGKEPYDESTEHSS